MLDSIMVELSLPADQRYSGKPGDQLAGLLSMLEKNQGIKITNDKNVKSGLTPYILVKLLNTSAITNFVRDLSEWLASGRGRTINIKVGNNSLEADKLSPKEQQDLIQWFQSQASNHNEK
jgi:hypothetical protein